MSQVLNGIDVLLRQGCKPLNGLRVGLITNHTGLTREGKPTWRGLLEAGVKLTALFSPEHGFAGIVDEPVKDARHPETGLPIYSLYGEHKAPTAEMLRAVDVLVFDIQDIGCRFLHVHLHAGTGDGGGGTAQRARGGTGQGEPH